MPGKLEFEELGREKVSDSTEIVISIARRDGKLIGYNINRYVNTEGFQGFTKGILIPDDMLAPVLALFPRDSLTLAMDLPEKEVKKKQLKAEKKSKE